MKKVLPRSSHQIFAVETDLPQRGRKKVTKRFKNTLGRVKIFLMRGNNSDKRLE